MTEWQSMLDGFLEGRTSELELRIYRRDSDLDADALREIDDTLAFMRQFSKSFGDDLARFSRPFPVVEDLKSGRAAAPAPLSSEEEREAIIDDHLMGELSRVELESELRAMLSEADFEKAIAELDTREEAARDYAERRSGPGDPVLDLARRLRKGLVERQTVDSFENTGIEHESDLRAASKDLERGPEESGEAEADEEPGAPRRG